MKKEKIIIDFVLQSKENANEVYKFISSLTKKSITRPVLPQKDYANLDNLVFGKFKGKWFTCTEFQSAQLDCLGETLGHRESGQYLRARFFRKPIRFGKKIQHCYFCPNDFA